MLSGTIKGIGIYSDKGRALPAEGYCLATMSMCLHPYITIKASKQDVFQPEYQIKNAVFYLFLNPILHLYVFKHL